MKFKSPQSVPKWLLISLLLCLFFSTLVILFTTTYAPKHTKVHYGVTFSKAFAEYLNLDWQKTYLAILDDLKVKKIRIPTYWTEVESQQDQVNLSHINWQVAEAKKRNAQIVLVLGQKQPRWPECHIPDWANQLSPEKRNQELLELIQVIVTHYKNEPTIVAWQIENEPFFPYGQCPAFDSKLLEQEVQLVKQLDPTRPVIITDSGELGTWYKAASKGDILGTTLYRIVWDKRLGYVHYPTSVFFYKTKAALIHYFTKVDKIIIAELQAEPWGPGTILNTSLAEQSKSMNIEQFQKNINYVNKVGFEEAYLWGVEWWYWLKTQQNDPALWEEAKTLF